MHHLEVPACGHRSEEWQRRTGVWETVREILVALIPGVRLDVVVDSDVVKLLSNVSNAESYAVLALLDMKDMLHSAFSASLQMQLVAVSAQ